MTFVMALYRNNGREVIPAHGFCAHINVVRPKSVGQLRLQSNDASVPPVIDQNYLSSPADLEVLRQGVRIAHRVFHQPAFNAYRGDELEPGADAESDQQTDAYIRSHAEADYHSAGTCRMGSGESAVVDAQLRVHGIEGLRVADASIMPCLIGGNTNMAVIMIAEKAADLILGNAPLQPASL